MISRSKYNYKKLNSETKSNTLLNLADLLSFTLVIIVYYMLLDWLTLWMCPKYNILTGGIIRDVSNMAFPHLFVPFQLILKTGNSSFCFFRDFLQLSLTTGIRHFQRIPSRRICYQSFWRVLTIKCRLYTFTTLTSHCRPYTFFSRRFGCHIR